jgi:hypothetical protein
MGQCHIPEQWDELEELEKGIREGIGDMSLESREIGLVIESARRVS